jgi:hypothetical protein
MRRCSSNSGEICGLNAEEAEMIEVALAWTTQDFYYSNCEGIRENRFSCSAKEKAHCDDRRAV